MNNLFKIILPFVTGTFCFIINDPVHAQTDANTVIDENFISAQSKVDDAKYDVRTIDYDNTSDSWAGANYPRAFVFGNRKSTTIGKTYLFSQAQSNNIGLVANGKLGLVVNSQGKVGIGTIQPYGDLHFANNINSRKIVLWGGANEHMFYGFGINDAVLRYQIDHAGASHVFYSGVDAVSSKELFRITGNGRVGIGVSNPLLPLDVAGRGRFSSLSGETPGVWLNKNGVDKVFLGMGNSTDIVGFSSTTAGIGWGFVFNTTTGNVGIGNDLPHAPLQFGNGIGNKKIVLWEGANDDHSFFGLGINDNAMRYQVVNENSSHVFYSAIDGNSSRELVKIKGNGRVGIGVSNPESSLDVNGALQLRNGRTASSFSQEVRQIYLAYAGGDHYPHSISTRHNAGAKLGNAIDFFLWNQGVDVPEVASGSQHVMTLDGNNNGSVGIGTINPYNKLHVVTEATRASIGSVISIQGNAAAPRNDFPLMRTSLMIADAASGAKFEYGGEFGIMTSGSYKAPFLQIATTDGTMPICMGVNRTSTMQVFQNQVVIGPNLPDPTAGAVAPYAGLNYTLGVRGRIVSSGITCKDLSQWADFVFDDDYELKSLEEVSDYIAENKHLPDVPSGDDVIEKGLDVSQMLKIHMQKIEELTLYNIQLQKQLKDQQLQIDKLVKK